MQIDLAEVATSWAALTGTVFVPHSEEEYRQLGALLDQLVDEVGEDESHPLVSLMEIVGVLIEHYENTSLS